MELNEKKKQEYLEMKYGKSTNNTTTYQHPTTLDKENYNMSNNNMYYNQH